MTMTDDDVEQLLRRTYREVADRTDATTSPVLPDPDAVRPRRWQPALAAAAVIAVVVGGLLALANRGGEAPAAIGEPRHIVPGWIPRAGPDPSESRFALIEITSTADVDRLVWSADTGSVTLEYDRAAMLMVTGAPATVRDAQAVRTPDGIAWSGPAGGVATVRIEGDVSAQVLDDVVASIIYVDDDMWTELTATAGFVRAEDDPLASWRVGGEHAVLVELIGDLHDGITVSVADDGSRTGFTPGLQRSCASSVQWSMSRSTAGEPADSFERLGYSVFGQGAVTEVVVSAVGEVDQVIEMTPLRPVLDLSFGTVVYDDRSLGAPLPTCESSGS